MKKTPVSRKLGFYFVATTLCLAIISTSLSEGLIKTTYGYGYGYGYGNNKTDDPVKDSGNKETVISDTKTITLSDNTANDQSVIY